MSYKQIDKQFEEKFEKCDGYMCEHETIDKHYVVFEDNIR